MILASERGGAVGVQNALLWSALLLIVLTGLQVSMAAIASQLALSAAETGLRAGRYADVQEPVGGAQQAALRFLQQHAEALIVDPRAEATEDGAGILTVRVTGQVTGLLPDLGLTVDRAASAAIEQPAP